MFSTGTRSPMMGWWMVPRTISPLCRHSATRSHCDSFTVWPTRSCSTRVGRLLGRICPITTSSGSPSLRAWLPATGTSRSRSEKERSASTLQLPMSRCRCSSASGPSVVWDSASSAGVGIDQADVPSGDRRHPDGHLSGTAAPCRPGANRPRPCPTAHAARRHARPRGPAGGRRTRWSGAPRRRRSATGAPRRGTAPRQACAIRPRRLRPPCPPTRPPRPCGPTTRRGGRGGSPPP